MLMGFSNVSVTLLSYVGLPSRSNLSIIFNIFTFYRFTLIFHNTGSLSLLHPTIALDDANAFISLFDGAEIGLFFMPLHPFAHVHKNLERSIVDYTQDICRILFRKL